MSSRDYWRKREAENLKRNLKKEKAYEEELIKIYQNMIDSIIKEIDSFYGKYARTEHITLAEAKRRVAKVDIEAYERKAKRYVKEKNFSKRANEEMRLYNLTMKINRLEMLKANIALELISCYDQVNAYMDSILYERAMEEFERQAGILGKTVGNNAKYAHAMVNASFHNATFSDRIWAHQEILKAELSKLLQRGLIQGKGSSELARELRKTVSASVSDANRLMRTELARVQVDAQLDSLARNGFEEFLFIANGSCCEKCQALNDKHFKIKDVVIGENAPPMHPNCRCAIATYSADKEYEDWLDYVSNGGTTEEWERLKTQKESVKINKTDKKAIFDYMSATSYAVNEKLRAGGKLNEKEALFVKNLDKALDKMPKYKGDLRRSVLLQSNEEIYQFLDRHERGSIVTYKEYLSTTKGSTYNPKGQIQIRINNTKKGKDISFFNKQEKEIIYKRGSSFKVMKVTKKDGKYYIVLEEK